MSVNSSDVQMYNQLSNDNVSNVNGNFDDLVRAAKESQPPTPPRQLTPVAQSPPTLPSPARHSPSVAPTHRSPSVLPPDTNAEKHGVLLELQRLRQGGATLTREWTMADALEEMQMEVRKLSSNIDEMQMVNMMRDMMRLGFTGIEFFNARIGLLQLDGWSEAMVSEMHKYDPALRKLYQKWWRRSSTSPEMEILIGIGTSLVMHHAQNKFRRAANTSVGGGARRKPPRGSNRTFTMPTPNSDSDAEEAPPPGDVQVEFM